MRKILSFTLIILLFSCGQKLQKRAEYYIDECTSVDSIFSFYIDNPRIIGPKFLSLALSRLRREGSVRNLNEFMIYWEKHLYKLPPAGVFYFYSERFRQLIAQDQDSAYLVLQIMDNMDDVGVNEEMTKNELKGVYYYYRSNFDSAIHYMKNGYEIALNINDPKFVDDKILGAFATSLGGLYSLSGQSQSATEYLLRGLSYDSTNTILINNLASVLILEKRYKEAESLFKKYPEKLKEANTNDESINFKLTYIHLNQKLGYWDVSRKWLKSIGSDEVPDVQRVNYELFEIEQINHDKPYMMQGYLNDVVKGRGWDFYNTLFYTTSDMLEKDGYQSLAEHFQKNITKLDTNQFDELCFAAYFHLLGNKNAEKGNYSFASRCFKKSKDYYMAYVKESEKAELSDLGGQLELIRLEQRRNEASKNAEIALLELKRNRVVTYFSLAILMGGIFVVFRGRKLMKKNLELNRSLYEQKEKELEILEREKETSKKLIELSARVLEKSKDLKQTLNRLPDKSAPEVRKSLEDLEYILMLNKSVDTTVITRGYSLEELDYLDEITESQRNVLSLTLDGYRPKEIAVTLNLSYSYVRNVQSKLRKILKTQGFEDFDEFKKEITPKSD